MIKLQCVIYQWICLNDLNKIMKDFFLILESFFELGLTTIFLNNRLLLIVALVLWKWGGGGILCWTSRILVSITTVNQIISVPTL